MSEEGLFPEIPVEIKACRIGSCINSRTRSLMPNVVTFDPNKLEAKWLRFVSGEGRLKCFADSSSTADAEGSFFALDTKLQGQYLGCTASAGFNMEVASKSTNNSQGINCFISYIFKGQYIQLLYQSLTPETLYNFMTDDFQKRYDQLMSAKTNQEYIKLYQKFTSKYGHGCVTALHLTAGSACRINIQYSDKATANTAKYGASIAVNTPFGGASGAAAWGKEIEHADSKATMSVLVENLPEKTPTSEWCGNMANTFVNQGISILAQKASVIEPTKFESPKAPEFPDLPKPDKKKKPPRKDAAPDLSDELKKELMKEDGFDPDKTKWADYVKAQEDAYNALSPKSIVKDALKSDSWELTEQIAGAVTNDNTDPDLGSNAGDVWDLGGYIPYAYEITPWNVLFPDIQLKLPQTFASIWFAKMYMFYFTRLQFAQYLFFLSDVGPGLCMNDCIESDTENYAGYCDDLLKDIAGLVTIDENVYKNQVKKFEDRLSLRREFHSKDVYDTFFKNYDIFYDSPYGFIPVDSSGYICPDQKRPLPKPFSITPMLGNALRFYPVIIGKDIFTMLLFDKGWNTAMDPISFTDVEPKTDDNGYQYLQYKGIRVRLYYAGFKDIPRSTPHSGEFFVRGLPMLDELPFDEMKEFAKPSEE